MPITPLFVPGIRFDRFEQALQSGADTIIIDLEDSVFETQKDAARNNLVKFSRKNTNILPQVDTSVPRIPSVISRKSQ